MKPRKKLGNGGDNEKESRIATVTTASLLSAILLLASVSATLSSPFSPLSSSTMIQQAFATGNDTTTEPETTTTEYSGRAIAALVKTGLLDLELGDTGPLPPTGGMLDATVLEAVVQIDHSMIKAEILESITKGANNVAQSEAATANVVLMPGTLTPITADLVEAKSTAVCNDEFGTSNIVDLKIAGVKVLVTGEPNQQVSIPLVGTLIINEQIINESSEEEGKQEIIVNALHLKLAGGDEVVVSSAYSDILCGEHDPSKFDHVDGDGSIEVDGEKASFDFSVGFKFSDKFDGHFNYEDVANDVTIESTEMVKYEVIDEKTRKFAGFANVNGMSGIWFAVWVTDNGEPGKGVDHFKVILPQEVTDFYSAEGYLAHGEITLYT